CASGGLAAAGPDSW
nr:immunoglobulin heavy chain junction region [Macaca mulatta]MOW18842.1 immunoglobulin heavy chain junction region [Macaca mulatta]MOW18846.1 immunoglobulin heavy chain junction region [Macaca mulatta]MOW18884.1 immunoglobulin heavy chain junction region [Macaca mulatta]MOW18891.1 immunoglobulin heavy chain junction region [Macaca mulatta]